MDVTIGDTDFVYVAGADVSGILTVGKGALNTRRSLNQRSL